jgi:hypothetical protein
MQGEKELQNFPADAGFIRHTAPVTAGFLMDTTNAQSVEGKNTSAYENILYDYYFDKVPGIRSPSLCRRHDSNVLLT